MSQIDLKSLPLFQWEPWLTSIDEPIYRKGQLLKWLFQKHVKSFEDMSNVPETFRHFLQEKASLDHLTVAHIQESRDGTRKFLFRLHDGETIESVYMPRPDKNRATLCISTQVGCRIHCQFCLTAQQGLIRNLTPGEIVEQWLEVKEWASQNHLPPLTQMVLMGMGEPLDNFESVCHALEILMHKDACGLSPRRITISTSGIIPGLLEIVQKFSIHIAISLNASTQKVRSQLMPISRKYTLEKLLEACREIPLAHRDRITFEYVLLRGVNDEDVDAQRLVKLLKGLRCKVNLIPFNPFPDSEFRGPSEERVSSFQKILTDAYYSVFIRQNRGRDILAACGQLRSKASVSS